MKRCSRCREEKPLKTFSRDRTTVSGYCAYCKECNKAKNKRIYQKQRLARLEKAAAYREDNRDKIRKSMVKYNRKNASLIATKMRKYRKDNPDKVKETLTRSRMKRYGNRGKVEQVSREAVFAKDAEACYLCETSLTLETMSLDHEMPLVRGGDHTLENCRCACWPCNNSKRDKTAEEYRLWLVATE